jgi:hypothetical protein
MVNGAGLCASTDLPGKIPIFQSSFPQGARSSKQESLQLSSALSVSRTNPKWLLNYVINSTANSDYSGRLPRIVECQKGGDSGHSSARRRSAPSWWNRTLSACGPSAAWGHKEPSACAHDWSAPGGTPVACYATLARGPPCGPPAKRSSTQLRPPRWQL